MMVEVELAKWSRSLTQCDILMCLEPESIYSILFNPFE